MPLADPTSVYLENLARRRAEAEIMRQQGLQVAQGLQSGIGQMGEAMRIKKSDEDKAAATAREVEQQGVVNAREAEGLRIRQAQEKREAEGFAAEQAIRNAQEGRAAEEFKAGQAAEAAAAPFRLRKAEAEASAVETKASEAERENAKRLAVETYNAINDLGGEPDEVYNAAIAHATAVSGLSEPEVTQAIREDAQARADAEAKNAPKPSAGPRVQKAPTVKAEPTKPLEATMVKDVADLDAQLDQLRQIQIEKPGVNTGPISSFLNRAASVVDWDDPKFRSLKAKTANVMNEVISRLSGANVPPAEWERLVQGIPQPGDDDDVFQEKLSSTIMRIETTRRNILKAARAAGRDVSGFDDDIPASSVRGAPPSADDFVGG